MATIVDGFTISIQSGVNYPAGLLRLGGRFRTDGAFSGEVAYGLYSGRGAVNPATGDWSVSLGVGQSFGDYNQWGGRVGAFMGIGIDENKVFWQATFTGNFPLGNSSLTPLFTGLRFDIKLPLIFWHEIGLKAPPPGRRDPLVLDLDGDGVEVTSLTGSQVFFDYDLDGVAERTGWVSPDDGILAFDANSNGSIDGAGELFGSPTQDGFEVLETLDSNGDGRIDAQDEEFANLRIWRDADGDAVSDPGELVTLEEAEITAIELTRTAVNGTNNGHGVGFQANFIRVDNSTGVAQTIYFQTDRQDTADPTPEFTPAEDVDKLPKLPRSGLLLNIAYVLSNDATFRADWTALADNAATLAPDELRMQLEGLLLRWAGVDEVNPHGRGQYIDGRHLAFVEAFFGQEYRETQFGQEVSTYPGRPFTGAALEATFQSILDVLQTSFLTQLNASVLLRATDTDAALVQLLESPYYTYSFLDFPVTRRQA